MASGIRRGSESMWPRPAQDHPENTVSMQPLYVQKDPSHHCNVALSLTWGRLHLLPGSRVHTPTSPLHRVNPPDVDCPSFAVRCPLTYDIEGGQVFVSVRSFNFHICKGGCKSLSLWTILPGYPTGMWKSSMRHCQACHRLLCKRNPLPSSFRIQKLL